MQHGESHASSEGMHDGDNALKRKRTSGIDASNIIGDSSAKRRAVDAEGGSTCAGTGGIKLVLKKPTAPAEPGQFSSPADVRTEALKLISLIENEKVEGRNIGEDFAILPSRVHLPDYYDIIKKPIAVRDIRERLAAGFYASLANVKLDLEQIFVNAKRYNQAGSRIYNDAKLLHKLLKLRYGVMIGTLPPDAEQQFRQELNSPLNALKDWLNGRLRHLTTLADSNGRPYSQYFMDLPSKELYPDYYKLITQPMAFNVIQNKISKKIYTDVKSFRDDVSLIFANAYFYNQEGSLVSNDAHALEAAFAETMRYVPPEFDAPSTKIKIKLGGGGAPTISADSPGPRLTLKIGGSSMTPGQPTSAPTPEPVDPKTAALLAAQAEKDAAIAALPVIDYATADPAEVIRHLQVRGVHPAPSQRPPPPPTSPERRATVAKTGGSPSISHIAVTSASAVAQTFALMTDVVRQHSIVLNRGVDTIEIVPSLADSFAPGLPPVLNLRCVCRPPTTRLDQGKLTPEEASARGTRASAKLIARPSTLLTTIDMYIRPPGQSNEELYRLFIQTPALAS